MKKGLTELVFIIDKSGSMSGLENDTIGSFNSMLNEQKNVEGEAIITTVLFDNGYEVIHGHVDIRDVQPMTRSDYVVGGSAALLDAIGKTMHKIRKAQKRNGEDEKAEKVLFVIITDGEENSSKKFTYQKIKDYILHYKKKHGWEFVFFGANIDTVETASKIGISAEYAQSYTSDSVGISSAYKSMSMMSSDFRTGREPDTVSGAMANLKNAMAGLKSETDDLKEVCESIEANGGKIPDVNEIVRKVIGHKSVKNKLKSLCSKCLYKLGIVKAFANPCPKCKLNGYNMYFEFEKRMHKQSDDSKTK